MHLNINSLVIEVPCVVKAYTEQGRRLVEVEASCEEVDGDGDLVLQSALLASAASFCATGFIDYNHQAELAGRYGLPDGSRYIIGEPQSVLDLGYGRTGVVGELYSHSEEADKIWKSLVFDKVEWRASIYGLSAPRWSD